MASYVYLLASKKYGTLYLGVTSDLVRRGSEHRTKAVEGFTARYAVDRLVLVRNLRRCRNGDCARKGIEEVEAGLENQPNRTAES
jgi:predicted GIY-YIG superfamily endonuclease